jgi:hypothetical protein
LRYLPGIEIFLDGGVARRTEAVENQEHPVAFDQLARLLDGFRRAISIVIGYEGDFAPVYSALVVDLVEIDCLGPADDPPRRSRTAVRHDIADLDFAVACAGVVSFLRRRRLCRYCGYAEKT